MIDDTFIKLLLANINNFKWEIYSYFMLLNNRYLLETYDRCKHIDNSNSLPKENKRNRIAVSVYDLKLKTHTIYSSINEVAKELSVSTSVISRRLKLELSKPYKSRYLFTKGEPVREVYDNVKLNQPIYLEEKHLPYKEIDVQKVFNRYLDYVLLKFHKVYTNLISIPTIALLYVYTYLYSFSLIYILMYLYIIFNFFNFILKSSLINPISSQNCLDKLELWLFPRSAGQINKSSPISDRKWEEKYTYNITNDENLLELGDILTEHDADIFLPSEVDYRPPVDLNRILAPPLRDEIYPYKGWTLGIDQNTLIYIASGIVLVILGYCLYKKYYSSTISNESNNTTENSNVSETIHDLRDEVRQEISSGSSNPTNIIGKIDQMREQAISRVNRTLNLKTEDTTQPQLGEELQKLDHVLNSDYSPNTSAPAIDRILSNIARVENNNSNTHSSSQPTAYALTRSDSLDSEDEYLSQCFVGSDHPDYVPLRVDELEEIRKASLQLNTQGILNQQTDSVLSSPDSEYELYSKMFVPIRQESPEPFLIEGMPTYPEGYCFPNITPYIIVTPPEETLSSQFSSPTSHLQTSDAPVDLTSTLPNPLPPQTIQPNVPSPWWETFSESIYSMLASSAIPIFVTTEPPVDGYPGSIAAYYENYGIVEDNAVQFVIIERVCNTQLSNILPELSVVL